MAFRIGIEDLRDIAVGATFLGTGGGGDPYIGRLMAETAIRDNGPITVLEMSDLTDDMWIVPSAMMGAPTVMLEKIPNGSEMIDAFERLRARTGQTISATMPIEAGGINSMIPLAVAARLGLPVVDADGMGRAFPELQMVSFSLHGISATPMILVDERRQQVSLDTMNNTWTEALSRTATMVMGGSSSIALYLMTGAQVRAYSVPHSLSHARHIGERWRACKSLDEPMERLIEALGAYRLFDGKIVDLLRRTVAGFARGEVAMEGMGRDQGHGMRLDFQNENLVAVRDGEVVASVPDLICVLDQDSLLPVTTEGLRYGRRVTVIGLPCAPVWRTPVGIRNVGPRYFGYDVDYIPIEMRYGHEPATRY
ncbi:MAG: DUF917 domain-containing protein [Alicyclobacillus sp.]|nr:DUF917 domain-containing protein [Alicyclobacillus sp.]